MKNTETMRQLLTNVDQAYDRQSWHGTNLRGSLRGVRPALAARRYYAEVTKSAAPPR